jgi:RecJ-like exonuclease
MSGMLETCEDCGGEGRDYTQVLLESCPLCKGEGTLRPPLCSSCKGKGCSFCSGHLPQDEIDCPRCEGSGEVEVYAKCSSCRGHKTIVSPKFRSP